MAWNDERIELLKRLYGEGLSASQIANKLGGCTRNAVIGKCMRLGLVRSSHSHPKATRGCGRPRKRRHDVRSDTPLAKSFKLSGDGFSPCAIHPDDVGLADGTLETRREKQCAFPIGDPQKEGFGYCKRDREFGAYCERHFLRMWPGATVRLKKEPIPEPVKTEMETA